MLLQTINNIIYKTKKKSSYKTLIKNFKNGNNKYA